LDKFRLEWGFVMMKDLPLALLFFICFPNISMAGWFLKKAGFIRFKKAYSSTPPSDNNPVLTQDEKDALTSIILEVFNGLAAKKKCKNYKINKQDVDAVFSPCEEEIKKSKALKWISGDCFKNLARHLAVLYCRKSFETFLKKGVRQK